MTNYFEVAEVSLHRVSKLRKVDLIMIKCAHSINVYSTMNEEIDFCILIGDCFDFPQAIEIVDKAYHDYWQNPEAECSTVADWIGYHLNESGIEYEIYFK